MFSLQKEDYLQLRLDNFSVMIFYFANTRLMINEGRHLIKGSLDSLKDFQIINETKRNNLITNIEYDRHAKLIRMHGEVSCTV